MSRDRVSLELGPAVGWQNLNQRIPGPSCLFWEHSLVLETVLPLPWQGW